MKSRNSSRDQKRVALTMVAAVCTLAAGSAVARPRYAGRTAAASPATGLAKRHANEQAALVANALALSVRGEIRRRKRA